MFSLVYIDWRCGSLPSLDLTPYQGLSLHLVSSNSCFSFRPRYFSCVHRWKMRHLAPRLLARMCSLLSCRLLAEEDLAPIFRRHTAVQTQARARGGVEGYKSISLPLIFPFNLVLDSLNVYSCQSIFHIHTFLPLRGRLSFSHSTVLPSTTQLNLHTCSAESIPLLS